MSKLSFSLKRPSENGSSRIGTATNKAQDVFGNDDKRVKLSPKSEKESLIVELSNGKITTE